MQELPWVISVDDQVVETRSALELHEGSRVRIEQLVFETDYPHQDSTWPHTDRAVAEIAERVTPEELEMLVRTNAIKMLDLDPADLRPATARAERRNA